MTYLLENSNFLLFLNDHRVLLKKLELHDRLKKVKSLNFPVNIPLHKKLKKKKKRKIGGQQGCSHPLGQVTRLKLNDGRYGRHVFKSRSASLLPLHHGGVARKRRVKIT